jgi:hypothetical protein
MHALHLHTPSPFVSPCNPSNVLSIQELFTSTPHTTNQHAWGCECFKTPERFASLILPKFQHLACPQGDNGMTVTGKRWELLKVDAASHKPFPTIGRAVATHKGSTAEALLELPTPQTKAKDELQLIPAGLWVTVGLLAQDKLALQLRLKRCEQPSERDKEGGTWHVYHATGGAITLLEGIEHPKTTGPGSQRIQTLTDLDLD